jgi:hypothetical protein
VTVPVFVEYTKFYFCAVIFDTIIRFHTEYRPTFLRPSSLTKCKNFTAFGPPRTLCHL